MMRDQGIEAPRGREQAESGGFRDKIMEAAAASRQFVERQVRWARQDVRLHQIHAGRTWPQANQGPNAIKNSRVADNPKPTAMATGAEHDVEIIQHASSDQLRQALLDICQGAVDVGIVAHHQSFWSEWNW